jgi:hypothetical protein
MTNRVHRYGSAESLALRFKPVNIGDPSHGGALRHCNHESVTAHWHRDVQPKLRAVIDGIDEPASVAAVFDNRSAAENILKALKAADLGLCINLSTSIEGAQRCSKFAGIAPYNIGYSVGFEGRTEKLPDSRVLALTTMGGHGMISSSLGKKMIDWVKEDRRTPEQAVTSPTRFCSCGIFNPARAKRILEDARKKMD